MEIKPQQTPDIEIVEEVNTGSKISSRVILYNDDWHTFDEVINQLIKATRCTYEQARSFAFEVHVKGKSNVFSGTITECIKVSGILEEIALHTQIVT